MRIKYISLKIYPLLILISISIYIILIYQSITKESTGIYHGENIWYDSYQLSDAGILLKIFNVYELDPMYRGREIGNIINLIDVYFIKYLYVMRVPFVLSIIHYIILTYIFFKILFGKIQKKNDYKYKIIIILMFFIFLLTPTIYVSGLLHFRTSKILVFCIAFIITVNLKYQKYINLISYTYLFLLITILSLIDEQGFFIAILFTLIFIGFYLIKLNIQSLSLVVVSIVALLFRQFYYYKIGVFIYEKLTLKEIDLLATSIYIRSTMETLFSFDFYINSFLKGIQENGHFFGIISPEIQWIFVFILFLFLLKLDIKNWKQRTKNLFLVNLFNPLSYLSLSYIIFLFSVGILTSLLGNSILLYYYSIPSAGLLFLINTYYFTKLINRNNNLFILICILIIFTGFRNYQLLENVKLSNMSPELNKYYNQTINLNKCITNPKLPTQQTFGYTRGMWNFPYMCEFYKNL